MTNVEYINPSVGKIGEPYFDENNNRVKFFSTEIHSSKKTIDDDISKCINLMIQTTASRICARFITTENSYNNNIEARIKLNNGLTGNELIYVGLNSKDRIDSEIILNEEKSLVEKILSTNRHKHNFDELNKKYTTIKLNLNNITEYQIESMVELYSEAFKTYTTKLDKNSIKNMIENSVVYGVIDNETNRVVSTSVAEISSFDIILSSNELKQFSICELSEMATKKEYRGQGLVTLATELLIEDIRNKVSVIYAESRACHEPINISFYNMGFSFGGRLNKQCILSGDSDVKESGPYENLNVWYMLPHEK